MLSTDLAKYNVELIIRTLKEKESCTYEELEKITGLPTNICTNIVLWLITHGYVVKK